MQKGQLASLDAANIALSKELWGIKSSLTIYKVIGLNADSIESGKEFLVFVRNQSLAAVALGLAKVFEREGNHELCSVSGVYRLAKQVQIQNVGVAKAYVEKYGIDASKDWIRNVDQIFSRQRPLIRSQMQTIDEVRNTRLAHIQQDATAETLPSIAAFEDLLGFAFEFHLFINGAFLNTHSHPILDDRLIESSLTNLLKKTGLSDPVLQFKDI